MKEYVVAYYSDSKKCFLETIYKTSLSHDYRLDNAIKMKSLDIAKEIVELLNQYNNYEYHIFCIETTFEEVKE